MKTVEFRERLLVALFATANSQNLGAFLDPAEVANAFGLERRQGQLRLIVDDLEMRGLVRASRTLGGGDEGGLDLQLTSGGVEEAEDLLEQHPEYASSLSPAPASDRYVTLSDNQRSGVSLDVRSLQAVVFGANDVGDEDRQVALSEIAAFEATITQPRVSTELVERFVNRILNWIKKTFGDALVGAIAGALITKLVPFLAS